MGSAAGFVQVSACAAAGTSGVTCGPSDVELFATGMNGDEDLAEDITMKGDKFHYVQQGWTPVKVESTGPLPKCHGNNGPDGDDHRMPDYSAVQGDDLSAPEKVHTIDPKIAKS